MSTGGGLNCLDGSSYSQNVYFARNRLQPDARLGPRGDDQRRRRRGLLRQDRRQRHDPDPGRATRTDGDREWRGAGVFILAGRGAGQYRRVAGTRATTVEIDRPWAVDAGRAVRRWHHHVSRPLPARRQRVHRHAGRCSSTARRSNAWWPATAARGCRASADWGCGTTVTSRAGSASSSDNEIAEGNYYHWDSAAEAMLEIYGAKYPPYEGPLNRGADRAPQPLAGQRPHPSRRGHAATQSSKGIGSRMPTGHLRQRARRKACWCETTSSRSAPGGRRRRGGAPAAEERLKRYPRPARAGGGLELREARQRAVRRWLGQPLFGAGSGAA